MTTFRTRTNPDYSQRNAELLAAYRKSRSTRDRNALIHANLPLVWRVARQEAQRSGHSVEDLCQEGCLGLIKAVERFDPERGHSLSTAAMPWIRGAIRHYLRDRCQPISGSHHLLDLYRRGRGLQQERRQQGLPVLGAAELAQALGCLEQRWQQALARQRSLQLASLDQPLSGSDEGSSLVERLAAPQPEQPYARAIRGEQRRHLWRSLRPLERRQRRLLLGRLLQLRSWQELAQPLGMSARAAHRRCDQLVLELRQQLQPVLGGS
jgi:RNA polymerase sigma factor (sigma-70 family)